MVYPNPGRDIVYIPALENGKVQRLEVFDLSGNVLHRDNSATSARVDVSFLPSGVYFFKLHNGEKTSTAKWVKLD